MKFFRLTSQAIRKSSLTRVNILARQGTGFDWATSRANFLHLEAQISLNLALILVGTPPVPFGTIGVVKLSSFMVVQYISFSKFVNSFLFLQLYMTMKPFQKSRLALLEELRELVSDALTESHATRFGTMNEKRQNRKLKLIRKEVDKWIEEMEEEEDNKVNDKVNETLVAA
jgi:hypothetical protein